jgi:hypothetical protein
MPHFRGLVVPHFGGPFIVRPVKVRHFIATSAVVIASLYVTIMAVMGYGFGQLYMGTFSWIATICALSALGSIFGGALCSGKSWCRLFLTSLSVMAILCFGLEVFQYYRRLDIPEDIFPWDTKAPFLLGLVILFTANLFGWRDQPNNSLERTRDK